MKRERDLFQKIISHENCKKAVLTVCKSHRWIHYPNKPNETVRKMESEADKYADLLSDVIGNGFVPSPVIKKKRYDVNAGKWRDICEPRIFPDQCVHHALIQVLESVMMRGMDRWCCGSIKGRGAHYGINKIKKAMKRGKGMKYCIELDIRHFYDSLKPRRVIERFKTLIKDYKTLDLIERVISNGIQIGAYCSQWFANTFLQPLDVIIRQCDVTLYIRYMDNFTIFTNRKKTAHKIVKAVEGWLNKHDLALKGNWQIFPTRARLPNALGYRFGKKYTLIRKKNLLRLRRCLKQYYFMRERKRLVPVKFAQGLLSRLGQLRHCNSVKLYTEVKRRTQRNLKDVIREYYGKERPCNTYTGLSGATA